MYSYVNPTWQRIKRRIAERTGLNDDNEIEAYSEFCHHADSEDGLILPGDVEHEFYTHLLNKSPQHLKDSEKRFYQDYFNNPKRKDEVPKSPLSLEAQEMYTDYLIRFVKKGLISPPTPAGCSNVMYPVLKGYNYFNDPDFYKKTIKDNSKSFELVNPWEGIPCPDSPGLEGMLN